MRARQAFVRACSGAACECCVRVRRSCACVLGASPARLSRLGAFFEEEALAEVGAAVEREAAGGHGADRLALPAELPSGAFFEEEALAEVGAAFEGEALGEDGGGRRALPADLRKAPGAKAPGAALEDEARAEHDGERRALLAEVSR